MQSEEEKKEYIEHEILDRLYCLNENDFNKEKVDESYIKAVLRAGIEAKELIDKQQKEIEELKEDIKEYKIQEDLTFKCLDKTKYMSNFISKDKIKEKLLEPIRKEAEEINKKFFEKDTGFEIEGAILQELGAIEGMILELLEE